MNLNLKVSDFRRALRESPVEQRLEIIEGLRNKTWTPIISFLKLGEVGWTTFYFPEETAEIHEFLLNNTNNLKKSGNKPKMLIGFTKV